jgi:hypothetical protein
MTMNKQPNEFGPGVISVRDWTMMSDGSTYKHVWAKRWTAVTNQASGIPGLRTGDRYHLIAYAEAGHAVVCIPGCQVQGYAACEKNPSLKGGSQAYSVEE